MRAILLSLLLLSCANPTGSIKKDIMIMKSKPHIFTSYQSGKHNMRFASSGAPTLPPILFIHGSPGSWESWAAFLNNQELQKKFQLISIDRPGFGGSDTGIAELSLNEQADAIFGALSFNKSGQRAIIIGHSYGAPVAVKLSLNHPESVKSIVLVAGSVDPDLEETKWYQNVATWWPVRSLIPNSLRVANEEIMGLKKELKAMVPKWKDLKSRIVIIQGDADDLVQKENVDFMKRLVADKIMNVEMIPGLNHFVPWKRPDLILKAIESESKITP